MISVFDLLSVGIGPSSSHTVGPMRAAGRFVNDLNYQKQLDAVVKIKVDLYGSLALTGEGHGTYKAIIMGLCGDLPETINPQTIPEKINKITKAKKITILGLKTIEFKTNENIIAHKQETLPLHSNGMRFTAHDAKGDILCTQTLYSVGGGFVVREHEYSLMRKYRQIPYPFMTAKELFDHCQNNDLQIRDIMFANEKTLRSEHEIKDGLLNIAHVMAICIQKGCNATEKYLPGEIKLKRRAPDLFKKFYVQKSSSLEHRDVLNWVNIYALSVAEENAAGGRIVSAPTNGAAGIVPAVLQYYKDFVNPEYTDDDIINFLLTAGALALLYKTGASISGAEVGCQGEVGVACSIAAGALMTVLGGSIQQIEKAAEIGMEHNLGLTCDPVAGLVQIPCIERNALAAIKAIDAALLVQAEGPEHRVSLDEVIATMKQTGEAMHNTYKETSLAGLAVNVPNC